jgi:hypothetical protein
MHQEHGSVTPDIHGLSEHNHEPSHGSDQELMHESIHMASEATAISANPESPGLTGS